MNEKIILGLCTANRCRSQMFEAIARHYANDRFVIVSAGTKVTFVHPLAIKVLEEIDIPVKNQSSKRIERIDTVHDQLILVDQNQKSITYPLSQISHVITLCGGAKESCPVFPAKIEKEHWAIDDPDQYKGSEKAILPYFRASRDDILNRIKKFMNNNWE